MYSRPVPKWMFGDIFAKDAGLMRRWFDETTNLSCVFVIFLRREGEGERHMTVQLVCEGLKDMVYIKSKKAYHVFFRRAYHFC